MKKRFQNQRFLTAGVNQCIHPAVQMLLWFMIEEVPEADYLQIFELDVEITEGVVQMIHKQEQPECEQIIFWMISNTKGFFDNIEKWSGKKLYVIDDGIAITTL